MDLIQRKLNRDEWNGIEIPITDREKNILKLITDGFHNVQIKYNNNITIIDFLKTISSDDMHNYIYETYLIPRIEKFCIKYKITINHISQSKIKLKKQDIIRIKNSEKNLNNSIENNIFEYKLLELFCNMIILINKNDDKWIIEYYTIKLLLNYKIENINKQLKIFLNSILEIYKDRIKIMTLIKNGYEMIEQNVNILKYADEELQG